jgi:hypothetical protein
MTIDELYRDKLVVGLRNRLDSLKHFYESRFERLQQFAHDELDGEQKRRFFNVVANGTAEWTEQHNWSGQIVTAEGRMDGLREKQEEALALIAKFGDEMDSLRADNARLLARCEQYEEALRHYADARNWTTATDFDNNYVIYSANFPMPGEGWAVAREALAGSEEGGNADSSR